MNFNKITLFIFIGFVLIIIGYIAYVRLTTVYIARPNEWYSQKGNGDMPSQIMNWLYCELKLL